PRTWRLALVRGAADLLGSGFRDRSVYPIAIYEELGFPDRICALRSRQDFRDLRSQDLLPRPHCQRPYAEAPCCQHGGLLDFAHAAKEGTPAVGIHRPLICGLYAANVR